jgi:hypothetical protein
MLEPMFVSNHFEFETLEFLQGCEYEVAEFGSTYLYHIDLISNVLYPWLQTTFF